MQKIKCDKCGALFGIKKIKVKTRTLDAAREIIQSYFKCPSCGEEYTVLITDPDTRALIQAGKRDEALVRSRMIQIALTESGGIK